MGCAHSQNNRNYFKRTNDASNILSSQNKFKVANVDNDGNEKRVCEIEITGTEILLRKNNCTIHCWPLTFLRKYGYDKNMFFFECGRRCETGPGIFAFKCDEADKIFLLTQWAIEKIPMVTGDAFFNDQMNLPEKFNQVNDANSVISSKNQQDTCTNNQNNQLIQNLNNNSTISQFINNGSVNPPPGHLYVNGPEYINLSDFNNGCLPNKNQSEANCELDNSKPNFNHIKLDDLQRNVKNVTNNNIDILTNKNDLINDENNIQEAIKKLDKSDKFRNADQELNYTDLDLKLLDNRTDFSLENGSESCIAIVSTAPPTPVQKFAKYNDFKMTNSVPTSPTSTSSPVHDSFTQQYSTIDFDKTKALTGIINDKERNE